MNHFLSSLKAKLNQGRDLSALDWGELEKLSPDLVKALCDKRSSEIRALICKKALDCGINQLAFELAISPYQKAYSALFLGKKQIFKDSLDLIKDQESLEVIILKLLELRFAGKTKEAVRWIETELVLNEASFEEDTLYPEYLQQVGAVYFHHSLYVKAFKYYEKSFNEFEFVDNSVKMAINAFNCAVSNNYFSTQMEHTAWLEKAKAILSQVSVPGLEVSASLFEADQTFRAGQFSKSIGILQQLFKAEGLSEIQNLLVSLYTAQVEVERGHYLVANIELAKALRILSTKKLSHFEGMRASLQRELAAYTNESPLKLKPTIKDERYTSRYEISELRSLAISLDANLGTKKLFQKYIQFQSKHSEQVMEMYFRKDLEFFVNPAMTSLGHWPRHQWAQVEWAVRHQNKLYTSHLSEEFKEKIGSDSSWSQASMLLARCFNKLWSLEEENLAETCKQGLALCRQNGMFWQSGYFLGLLAFKDTSYHIEWIEHLNQLPSEKRSYLRNFFKASLGEDVASTIWMVQSSKEGLALEDTDDLASILIDTRNLAVRVDGQNTCLKSQPKIFACLMEIAKSKAQGLSKQQLAEKVWELDYNPLDHDATIYRSIGRLRKIVAVDMIDGKYTLSESKTWSLILTEQSDHNIQLNQRQKQLLDLVKQYSGIGRKRASEALNVSPRTTLRDLKILVDFKLLTQDGHGRSTIYKINDNKQKGA